MRGAYLEVLGDARQLGGGDRRGRGHPASRAGRVADPLASARHRALHPAAHLDAAAPGGQRAPRGRAGPPRRGRDRGGALRDAPGVRRVHDLHVWTLTSGREAMSAHVVVDARHAGRPDPRRAPRGPARPLRHRPHDDPDRDRARPAAPDHAAEASPAALRSDRQVPAHDLAAALPELTAPVDIGEAREGPARARACQSRAPTERRPISSSRESAGARGRADQIRRDATGCRPIQVLCHGSSGDVRHVLPLHGLPPRLVAARVLLEDLGHRRERQGRLRAPVVAVERAFLVLEGEARRRAARRLQIRSARSARASPRRAPAVEGGRARWRWSSASGSS